MLSIVIPTLNEAKYIPFLLRSIAAQTYTDYEIIVGDFNSTDGTADLARAAGAKVVLGGRVAEGRNAGAKAAKGDIILFLDSDVVLPDPHFLENTISEFKKRKLGVATCKIDPMSDKKIDKVFHEAFNYFMWVTAAIKPHAPGFCIFVRKDVHEKVGAFDTDIKLMEDHDYVLRCSKVSKYGLLKSARIPVSVRRFDRDGRLNIAVKYILCELHTRTKGAVKSDLFNYTWGHDAEHDDPEKVKQALEEIKSRKSKKN